MSRNGEKCYMCHRDADSREHVPPKCLFPEKKDVGTSAYRNNLITVPSCELHNSNKSKDDEFLMVSIAGIIGNNSIGYAHNCVFRSNATGDSGGTRHPIPIERDT